MPYADPEVARAYKRAYYQAHRQEILDKVNRWTAENPERVKERKAIWYRDNRERISEQSRVRYVSDRENVIRRVREYEQRLQEENPEVLRARGRNTAARRRARLHEALVEHVDFSRVWERDAGICGICREPVDPADWHLDHIVPIARGGKHSYANVQVSHPQCNWRKAAS